MMKSMEILWILGTLLFLLAGWLVQHFAAPRTSLLIRLLVTVSFALGFGGIVLLPIDLTITTIYDVEAAEANDNNQTEIEPNDTYLLWIIVYWSTFFLAWVVLPLFREALLSGQFTFWSRAKAGFRKALQGYMLLVAVALSAMIGLVITTHTFNVIPLLMALGNTYGLLLVSLLLGYGLVDTPRQLWRRANAEVELRRTRIIASNADEALFEAVWELQDTELLIDQAASRVASGGASMATDEGMSIDLGYASCVDKLLTLRKSTAVLRPELQRRRMTTTGQQQQQQHHRRQGEASDDHDDDGDDGDTSIPSLDYLAKLHLRLQRAQAQVVRCDQRWNALVARSQLYADLVEGTVPRPSSSHDDSAMRESRGGLCGKLHSLYTFLFSYIRYIWLVTIRGPTLRLLAMVSLGLSVMVVWSEVTLSFIYNLSPFAILLRIFDERRGVLFQLAAMIPLVYISICVYSSMFKVSFFGSFRLSGYKQSPGVALVFNAQYLVRLQFPLAYNYLNIIKYDTSTTDCAFSHVMSDMKTVPFLGTSFSVYAPLLILALCGFTLCNGYARFLGALGLEHEDAILLGDAETLDAKVNEGITLLQRHRATTSNNNSTSDGRSLV